jgi:hypothetical protein
MYAAQDQAVIQVSWGSARHTGGVAPGTTQPISAAVTAASTNVTMYL